MNWIRGNKFLTGFIAVLVIGAGVLGFLLYTAWGTYSDVTDQFNAQAGELHRLQSLVPYPDKKNLAAYAAERDDLIDATHDLASSLSQMELPVVEMTPSAFQDRLRDITSAVKAKADKTGVTLGKETLALSFDQYEIQPPPVPAASLLGRQLEALNIAMNILIDAHVDNVAAFVRAKLPQETGGAAARPERGGGRFGQRGGGGGAGGNAGGGDLVEKVSFDVKFTAGQSAFQRVLNDFAASSKQFFITRTLVVQNSDPKPISKAAETPAPSSTPALGQPAPGAPDTSGSSAATSYLKFLVGTEKLNVAMRIEMVTFNPPDKSGRKAAAPSPAAAAHP